MGYSGERQFLQRIAHRRRPRRRESFPTAAYSVPYRLRCRRRPIRYKSCRCPELPTVRSSPHLPYIAQGHVPAHSTGMLIKGRGVTHSNNTSQYNNIILQVQYPLAYSAAVVYILLRVVAAYRRSIHVSPSELSY